MYYGDQQQRGMSPRDEYFDWQELDKIKKKAQDELKLISDRAIKDDQVWSYFCLSVAALGILVILFGIISAISGNILIAISEAAAGIMINGVTALAYKPRKDAQDRLDKIYNKETELERLIIAIEIAKNAHGEMQNRLIETIVDRIIDLSQEDKKVSLGAINTSSSEGQEKPDANKVNKKDEAQA